MKIKTQDLSDIALDYAVTTIEDPDALRYGLADWREARTRAVKHGEYMYRYHQSWAQGGPIIDRIEGFELKIWQLRPVSKCEAYIHNHDGDWVAFGPTPLIATMRVFVAAKLGDEVDIPEELL